ncbi:sulfotransferase [Bacteroidota bacterium]
MKDSYLTAGIRFRPLVRLLSRNQIACNPRSIARVLFLLQSSLWSSLFSRVEELKFQKKLDSLPFPKDPVFIVGHWRTGSTLLHQLMALDPEFAAPTLFQVALPDNFLVSYKFYRPLFSRLMGGTRPMDNVKIGMNEPQEDEYALFRLTTQSPLEKLIFPSSKRYYLEEASFLPDEKSLPQWENSLLNFYRKIQFATGKQILSKNPFNSMRIEHLARIFPESRFIHIVRNPLAVVPSTRNLWEVVQKQNILNRNGYTPSAEEISLFYAKLSDTLESDLSKLPKDRSVVIHFEDIEQNPILSIRSLYQKIGFPFSDQFENLLNKFLAANSDYKKNVFELSDEDKTTVETIMRKYMDCYNYI